MQGTQSSSIPDMTEKRGQLLGSRENEAILAAMDDEETENRRPAWLRRWSEEVQRNAPFDEPVAGAVQAERSSSSALKTGADTGNGFSGQSIEAAFAYETVFQFETEFEAETTEDWLDLSSEHDSSAGDAAAPAGQASVDTSLLHLPGKGAETSRAGSPRQAATTSPNPKAVRAAIFRLAQGVSNRLLPDQYQPEKETAQGVHPRDGLAVDGTEKAPPLPLNAQADFAEVAHRVWIGEEELSVEKDVERGLAPVEQAAKLESQAAVTPLSEVDLREEKKTKLVPAFNSDAATSEATEFSIASAAGGLSEIGLNSPVPSRKPSAVLEDMTSGGVPALAHDAGNLLSALKLYSELLALSGVLQARHSHYAEDLKLLAARSEVLIHRLLQSFTLTEQEKTEVEIRSQEQRSERAPLSSEFAASHLENTARQRQVEGPGSHGRVNSSAQDHVFGSLSREMETPETRRSGPGNSTVFEQGARSSAGDGIKDEPNLAGEGFTLPLTAVVAREPAPVPFALQDSLGRVERESPTGIHGTAQPVKPINLVELLSRWGSLLSMIAGGPIQIKFGPLATLPIQVSEEALERILVNLVHNAMTATRDGGSIRIGVGRAEARRPLQPQASNESQTSGHSGPASKMVLTVDDSGCGMTEQQIGRLLGIDSHGNDRLPSDRPAPDFAAGLDLTSNSHGVSLEPDPTCAPSSSFRRGRGMGVQIVRELVASSGGELAIFSRRGAGTRIEIQWPLLSQTLSQTVQDCGLPQRIPPASTANFSPRAIFQESVQDPHGNSEGAIAC